MEKLNGAGLKVIEYKQEYDKSQSEIVKGALLTSLELLVQQNLITSDAFNSIKNGDSEEDLRKVLLKNPIYKKSPKEMYKEYKKVDEKFNEALKQQGINGFFETEISIEDSRISVLRQFSMDKDFIMIYFGIREVDLIQLMKKRGFAEKFSVLRINKVFDEILEEAHEEDNIIQGKSLVYYNPDITGFSIDYFYHVDIDYLEMYQNIPVIAKRISDLDKTIERKFKRKTGIEFYMRNAQRENKLQTEKQNSKTVSAVQNPTTPLVAVPSATPAPTSASADQSQVQGISKKGHKSSGTQIEGKPENKNSPIKQKERNKNNKQQQKATEIPAAGDLEEVLVVKQQEPNLPPAGDINFESDDMI